MMKNKPTWRTTLYPHTYYGHIEKIKETAIVLQYPFFCWNGRIYESTEGVDTELTVADLD